MSTEQDRPEVRARDIMTKPVETVRLQDSVREVARLFTENHIGAAAVLDEHENPIGVITKTDIVRYEEEKDGNNTLNKSDLPRTNDEQRRFGYHLIDDDERVQNWMTPVIFAVKPETPLGEIARRMVRYGIHHIFVREKKGGPLAGIISSFDVLRQVGFYERRRNAYTTEPASEL